MGGSLHGSHTMRGNDQGGQMVRHRGMRGGRVHSVDRLRYGELVLNDEEESRAYLPSWTRVEGDVSGYLWWWSRNKR